MIVLLFKYCFVGAALITSFIKIETVITKDVIFLYCLLIAAFITPPDIISQIVMAIPLYFFIEVGFLIYFLIKSKKPEWRNCRRARLGSVF